MASILPRRLPSALALAVGAAALFSCRSDPPKPAMVRQDWFKITLGSSDAEPVDWSGSIQTPDGRLVHLSPWRFEKADKLNAAQGTWTAATRRAETPIPEDWFVGALHIIPKDKTRAVGAVLPNGIFAGLEGSSAVRVQTPHGVASFSPEQVQYGTPLPMLGGRVLVERAVQALHLTPNDAMEDDYPAVGGGWVAWIAYQGEKERLMVSRVDGSERQQIAEGEFFRPFLAAGEGRAHLVVSVHDGNTWRIGLAVGDEGKWSGIQIISDGGPDLMPRAVVDTKGDLRVVWQSFRDGRSRILMRRWNGQSRQEPVVVSENQRNAWEPDIAADSNGEAHIVWDAYDEGVYNVYYRAESGGAFRPQRRVAASPLFQAHAAVTVDANDNVWLAWDESGPNWGKDTGFLVRESAGTMLYEGRRLRVGRYGSRGFEAAPPLPAGLFEQAQLAADNQGNVWCLAMRRDPKLHAIYSQSLKRDRLQQYSIWDYAVMRLSENGWSAPITLTRSAGRIDRRAAIAVDPDGSVRAAWSGDGRTYGAPYPYVKHDVYTGWIPTAPASGPIRPAPAALDAPLPPAVPVHPKEVESVAKMRAHRVQTQGKQLRVLRGDMHRHTDLSFDGDLDGSLWDFYRYTIDAADFDYSAVTDHNSGDDKEYTWWLIQKSNDLFFYPGRFTPVYAYERSLRYPNGHRNLVWARRGVRTLPRSAQEEAGTEGAAKLYEYLRRTNGLAMSHTSGTLMGTDWRDNDPTLEPLAEIYQGARSSYEHEGAPRAPKADDPLTQPGGFRREGMLWNAWAKGFKVGVQASSDHASTHISYAVLLAEGTTRDDILNAIRARHAYAATDNIVLDVRAGDFIQGDIFTTSARPRISVHVEGTAQVDQVEIVRNGKYVFGSRPGTQSVKLVYEDASPRAGESYYYVRVMQRDGQMAWSSPMWIRYNNTK